ncbi:Spx/MgsR family RNA polymerase-binding regulatory protein [Emticicia agri]|uniref:Spx/MgsR family RNA polymerase-binding regulatory protein n=1 Tax=Emticicia agri TaxID=2492393 RepID=A0A4Q5M5Y3_9BACT|nr:Spx/MgsR family RNA polymerase-binding regulatory protein [Emticicia agri]RYU97599.1 Spx/MgsR family RNA polymerase-binding regulatory protein [Emticicia agri]
MLTVYGIPNCDTVKKTLDWFKTHNIAYQFHDYRKEGISADKLKEWLAQEPIDKIFNKNSTTFKELSEEIKSSISDEKAAINLMMNSNSIIKRPIVEDGTIKAIGFKADQYKAIFMPDSK